MLPVCSKDDKTIEDERKTTTTVKQNYLQVIKCSGADEAQQCDNRCITVANKNAAMCAFGA